MWYWFYFIGGVDGDKDVVEIEVESVKRLGYGKDEIGVGGERGKKEIVDIESVGFRFGEGC